MYGRITPERHPKNDVWLAEQIEQQRYQGKLEKMSKDSSPILWPNRTQTAPFFLSPLASLSFVPLLHVKRGFFDRINAGRVI